MELASVSLALVPGSGSVIKEVFLTDVSNKNTRRAYTRALERFLGWHRAKGSGRISREMMEEYRAGLVTSGLAVASINQELSALRRIFRRAAAAGVVDREAAQQLAGVLNLRSLGCAPATGLRRKRQESYSWRQVKRR